MKFRQILSRLIEVIVLAWERMLAGWYYIDVIGATVLDQTMMCGVELVYGVENLPEEDSIHY